MPIIVTASKSGVLILFVQICNHFFVLFSLVHFSFFNLTFADLTGYMCMNGSGLTCVYIVYVGGRGGGGKDNF